MPISQLFSAELTGKIASAFERGKERFLDGVLGAGDVAQAGDGVAKEVVAVKLHPMLGVAQADLAMWRVIAHGCFAAVKLRRAPGERQQEIELAVRIR